MPNQSNRPQQKGQPYDLDQLAHLWDNEKISNEQFWGQLLVWIQRLHERTTSNERLVENLEGEMADVVARVTTLEEGGSR